MYGFKPRHAQGKPVQNLAGGGIVHSLTGMLGMRKRTPEELRAADAKSQARNQEAATAAAGRAQAAPAPAAQAAPAKAISEYSGMLAMQRREKEQGLADGGTVKPRGFKAGGMIRGPGTGTSDSIETEKRPGTFIMPADSTKAIGPEALEELGEVESDSTEEQGEKMPVRLSNGEFELPPEQVQALGEAVLTVMRNATHQPAGGQEAPTGKGFTPHQFFSGGGTVKDKEQQRLANQTAMYVRGAQEAAANRPPEPAAPQPPAPTADPQSGQAAFGVFPQLGRNSAGTPAKIAAPQATAPVPATQVEGWRTKAVMDGAAEDAQAAWGRGGAEGVAGAAGAVARGAITAVPTAIGEFAYNTVAPLASTAKGFWNGVTGGGNDAQGTAQAPIATPPIPRPAAPAAPQPTAVQQAPIPAQQPGAQTQQPAMQSPNAGAGQVTRVGNSYSGTNIAGDVTFRNPDGSVRRSGGSVSTLPSGASPMGPAVGFAPGGISTQNMGAADALASREYAASMGRLMASGQIAAPAAGPSMSLSGGTFGFRRDRNIVADERGAQARFAYGQGTDPASRARNAQLQQTAMQEAGSLARTGIQEQGANARDAGRTAIARGELDMKLTAAGFQTRADKRLEDLQVSYQSAKTPEERSAIAQQLRELQVKDAPARYKVAAGGQQIDANGVAYKVPDRIFNEQTGVYSDGAGAAPAPQALPPGMKRQIGTSNGRPVYEDMNGKQVIAKG